MTSSHKRWFWVGVLAVMFIAFGARIYQLDHQSFWNDEGNSASLSSRSVQLIIEGTASDVHPPLYYLALRAWWPLVGQNDFSLRYFSVLAGLVQVAATIAIGRLWLSKAGTLALGFLVALSPPLVYYSQEARMYALLGAVATLSMLVLFKGLKQETKSITYHRLLVTVYCLLTAFGLYIHYVYPAVIVAQGLILCLAMLLGPRGPNSLQDFLGKTRAWLFAVLAAGLIYLPWIPIFLRTGSSTREAGAASAPEFLVETAFWVIGGPFARLDLGGWLYFAVMAIFFVSTLGTINSRYRRKIDMSLAWLLVPILLMFAVGATDENYRKFLTVAVPAFWMVVVIGVEWVNDWSLPALRPVDWAVFLIISSWLMVAGLRDLYFNPETYRDDYRAVVELIDLENRENAAVILNAPNQWEVFTWYAGDDGPETLYPLPKSRRPDDAIRTEVEALLTEHEFVYALFWGFEGFDPNRIVERTLDERAFKSTDEWYGDVRLATYGVPGDFLPNGIDQADFILNTEFSLPESAEPSGMRLDAAELSAQELQQGDVLGLALFWTSNQKIEERYKIFIQLLDDEGQIVGQRDAEPVGNLKPTDGWEVGENVTDQHGLLIPADLPPGDYQLVIGLYETLPPNRRLVPVNGQQDFISLGSISVVE